MKLSTPRYSRHPNVMRPPVTTPQQKGTPNTQLTGRDPPEEGGWYPQQWRRPQPWTPASKKTQAPEPEKESGTREDDVTCGTVGIAWSQQYQAECLVATTAAASAASSAGDNRETLPTTHLTKST